MTHEDCPSLKQLWFWPCLAAGGAFTVECKCLMVSPIGALKNIASEATTWPCDSLVPTRIFASYTAKDHILSVSNGVLVCLKSGSKKQERQWPSGKKLE